ncbi:MAG: hypothetical protein MEQ07_03465 [Aquimonas sp.]|nr:hypothetical protein [Aquimonas sp.]
MRHTLTAALLTSMALTAFAPTATASICEGGASTIGRSLPLAAWAGGHHEELAMLAGGPALGSAMDESLSVGAVLMRRQIAGCAPLAAAEHAGYVPKTEHDNTPWRFNMDAGKKLSAAEFDAWMKARGVRVVGQRPQSQQGEVPVTEVVGQ